MAEFGGMEGGRDSERGYMTQHGRELGWDGEGEGGRKKEPRERGGSGGADQFRSA